MTKYQVKFEPCVGKSHEPYGLYRLTTYHRQGEPQEMWEYVRDFASLEQVDRWILGAIDGPRVVREFELP